MPPKLTLHTYWRSSSSYRVRIALGYKKLAWDPVYVNLLAGEQRNPEHTRTSPMGVVPCLVVDGQPFVESVAILELVEELVPEPALLPKAPQDRARVRAMVEIVNAGTQPLQNLVVLDKVGSKEARAAWLLHFITRGLTAFEALAAAHGNAGPFAYGAAFTMADVFLVPQVYSARRFGVDMSAFPNVARAEAAALALPFVDAARPEVQPDAKP